ncbi:type I secretion system permease/ATPase [Azospirillum sp. ST 5-10]|uniref:type I secretion system permease/ATPase n=1 Tax=unclassified Azospirillum TaxID=2630922 RepID=UPI003F4A1631
MSVFGKKPAPAAAPAGEDLIRQVFAACRSAFVATGVFSLVVNLFILVLPLYMFSVFDRVLNSHSLPTLAFLFLIANFALLIQLAVDVARSNVLIQLSAWIERQLSPALLNACIANALIRGNPRGTDALNKLNSLRMFLSGQQIYVLMDAPWIPVFLAVLFILNFWIGIVAVAGSAVLVLLTLANNYITRPALTRANRAHAVANRQVQAAVRNANVVESMGMTPAVLARWSERNAEVLNDQGSASRRAAVIAATSKYARMAIQMGIMSTAALEIITPGSTLTGGAMMAATILAGRALMPLEQIISNWRALKDAQQNYHDLQEILRRTASRPRSTVVPPNPKGHLTVENVWFHPRGAERPVLSRISFSVEPGEVLGVVGPSAAGKSTLAHLLAGLQAPTQGHVRLDGADMASWPSEDLGRYMGYLPQDVELFGGPLRDNICRLDPDATPEAIIDAAEMAGLHEMIMHMPRGYDTDVGDQAALLSGGQRQRVGLARALYGNPRLLILDEPNASLDAAGEQALLKAVLAAKERGAAIIVIAHRPSILSVADKVLVLQNGTIQRLGERDQILPLITGQRTAPNVTMISKQANG